ncbi:hypothetical protein [Schlegelella koreensis]|uniref:Uncharacterized protein n=1 Tax=Piscinibacter koreensis TaxID=2742824 RepID=A0A7Y6NSN9_9BURK|nr:hypothetical protein [Schlegelella koreensis]NUZ08618.1 hypothetical protein [Schlegelella koreensis]
MTDKSQRKEKLRREQHLQQVRERADKLLDELAKRDPLLALARSQRRTAQERPNEIAASVLTLLREQLNR